MTKYKLEDLITDESYKVITEEDFNFFKKNTSLSDEEIKKLIMYKNILKIVNKTVNLTAIRDDNDIYVKHFLDSLYLNNLLKGNKILDIGTGAGFPGLVLSILNPDKKFLLVDSISKKTSFLNLVKKLLQLNNVEILTERFESIPKKYFEYFSTALCRGVSHLSTIIEYVSPYLELNGIFLPQKLTLDELNQVENTLKIFKFKLIKHYEFILLNGDKRYVIHLEKESKTDKKYPRKIGQAKKNPYY